MNSIPLHKRLGQLKGSCAVRFISNLSSGAQLALWHSCTLQSTYWRLHVTYVRGRAALLLMAGGLRRFATELPSAPTGACKPALNAMQQGRPTLLLL